MKPVWTFLKSRPPIISTLALASLVSAGLVTGRVIWTGRLTYAFLVWNLFLAWLPLILSLKFQRRTEPASQMNGRLGLLALAWLLLFPNAPYIFTDLVHLTTKFHTYFWVDLLLILTCAMTGLVLGFVSLYIMQSAVANRLGTKAGWWLVAVTIGLSGVGVYFGRFLRLNSWDVLVRPNKLLLHFGEWIGAPLHNPAPYVFSMLFAIILFVAYVMFYATTKLPQSLSAIHPNHERHP